MIPVLTSLHDSRETNIVAENYLDKLVSEYKIFIDTCSWMHDKIELFIEHIIPPLQKHQQKIYLARSVYEEVAKHLNDTTNSKRHAAAASAARAINRLVELDLIIRIGSDSDTFTDNILLSVFNKYRLSHKLALVTQDRALGADIQNLNAIQSSKGLPIVVRRINGGGYLSPFTDNNPSTNYVSHKSTAPAAQANAFKVASSITKIQNSPIRVTSVPADGDSITINGKTYRLGDRLGGGGEGTTYRISGLNGKVAKIYNKEHLDIYRLKKISLMLSRKISHPGICWPEELILNATGEFVGYVMPEASGKTPQRSIFIRPLFEKYFPQWRKRDLVELCVTILEKIIYLHSYNIIIGDINPENIMIKSPTEVYFVDCDSYQIEGFPCPVGTVNFTPPEFIGKRYDEHLRTYGNEYFAIATLLFMIMHPGKPPYSQQGGGNPSDNIRRMDFSYPCGEKSNQKQPDGPWRFMWSHLPRKIKDMFYATFRKDEPKSTESTRYTPQEWLLAFKNYLELLDTDSEFRRNDEQSEWIFPNRFKSIKTTCKECGREFDSKDLIHGRCTACDDKIKVACSICGRKFHRYDLKYGRCMECDEKQKQRCSGCGDKFYPNQLRHNRCKACMDKTMKDITCQSCGGTIHFTYGEYYYYKERGLDEPKRHSYCKTSSRYTSTSHKQYTPTTYKSPSTYSSSPINKPAPAPTTPTAKKKKLCFITTAVCEYLNKPDDCWELMLLRHFRDNYMQSTDKGQMLVEQYYSIAPFIVEALNESSEKDLIYKVLWARYIKPCIRLIVDEKPSECQELYCEMVELLLEAFADRARLFESTPGVIVEDLPSIDSTPVSTLENSTELLSVDWGDSPPWNSLDA